MLITTEPLSGCDGTSGAIKDGPLVEWSVEFSALVDIAFENIENIHIFVFKEATH